MVDLGIPGIDDPVEIGRGGVAVVYRAHQAKFGRDVAVKVLTLAGVDESTRDRFTAECQALGALSHHPNIVTVFDAGTTPAGLPYLVMEFLTHGSLDDRVTRDGKVDVGESLSSGVMVAGALESAHRAGVLHRDVKPGNILMSDFGEPLLADFGIARVAGKAKVTATGLVTGTPAHTAPEIFEGKPPSAKSDLYSLASTIYTLIAGSAPFARDTDEDIVAIIRRVALEDPPDLRPQGVPHAVMSVLERGMAKNPDDRPASLADFGSELRQAERAIGRNQTRMLVIGEAVVGLPDLPAANETLHVSPQPFTPSQTSRPATPRPFTPQRTGTPSAEVAASTEQTPTAVHPTPGQPTVTPPPVYVGGAPPRVVPQAAPARSNNWMYVVVLVVLVFIAAVIAGVVVARATGDQKAGGGGSTTVATTDSSQTASTATTPTSAPTTVATPPPPTVPISSIAPVSITASGTAAPGFDAAGNTVSYDPANAVDGDPTTAWRVDGDGLGATLTIDLGQTVDITEVGLIPGYAKVDPVDGTDRFAQNRRVNQVDWSFDDGPTVTQTFTDAPTFQTQAVSARSRFVTITIRSTTGGERDFTPISEIGIQGRA